ncbi:MAG: hypothetical protein HN501_04375 [Waddliaceae bacterium]|nr:hypothetical protein [Waddliaceae bacterium]
MAANIIRVRFSFPTSKIFLEKYGAMIRMIGTTSAHCHEKALRNPRNTPMPYNNAGCFARNEEYLLQHSDREGKNRDDENIKTTILEERLCWQCEKYY